MIPMKAVAPKNAVSPGLSPLPHPTMSPVSVEFSVGDGWAPGLYKRAIAKSALLWRHRLWFARHMRFVIGEQQTNLTMPLVEG